MINSTQVNQTSNLQAFCTAALTSQRRITIGLDSNLAINLFNAEAEQYFDLVASTSLGQSYDLLSKYLELDEIKKILTKKPLKKPVMQTNILTKVVNSSSLSKYLSWSVQQVLDENQLFLGFLLVGKETESPVVEQAKILSNISLENLINKIPGSLYFKDINGKYLCCNNFVVRMAEKNSILDIVGNDDYQFFLKEIAEEYVKNDREVITSGKAKIVEEPIKNADGTISTYITYKSPYI